MSRVSADLSDVEARARADRLLTECAWRVLRREGVPDEAIPARIERLWRARTGFRLPTVEELEKAAAEREPD